MNEIIERGQTHATFVLKRTYPAAVEAVWHALSDTEARGRWFDAGPPFALHERSHDFRVGGHGTEEGQWGDGGPQSRFFSTYTDLVEPRRIVFTYDMWIDGRHLSTSITTIALEPDGDQTRLTDTEQGVHFDGLDDVAGREHGSAGLLDQLGAYLS